MVPKPHAEKARLAQANSVTELKSKKPHVTVGLFTLPLVRWGDPSAETLEQVVREHERGTGDEGQEDGHRDHRVQPLVDHGLGRVAADVLSGCDEQGGEYDDDTRNDDRGEPALVACVGHRNSFVGDGVLETVRGVALAPV